MKNLIILITLISPSLHADVDFIYKDLKNKLEEIRKSPDADLENVYISKVNNENVIIDDGYPTNNPASFIYFIESHGKEFYINKIIGKTETIGVLNNFIVKGYDIKVNEDFNSLGYDVRDEINHNIRRSSSTSYINTLSKKHPISIPMGEINKYKFFMKYKDIDQFSNKKPQYIVECNGVRNNLSKADTVLMGYYKNDLKSPKFIGVENGGKFTYMEGGAVENFMLKNNVKCK